MKQDEIINNLKEKLKREIDDLKARFLSLRGNRPTVKLVEDIEVEIYEQKMKVKQVGSISIAPPREICISVWDKNTAAPVAKAIEKADLGVTPSVDGNLVRINLPPLTEERKQDLTKLIKKETEEARIRMREERDEARKKIEKLQENGEITEDDEFKGKEDVQEKVDKANKEVEEMMEEKLEEFKI